MLKKGSHAFLKCWELSTPTYPFLWVPVHSLRCQKSLETAMEILEREFEAVEKTKVAVDKLKTWKLEDAKAAPLPAHIRDGISSYH